VLDEFGFLAGAKGISEGVRNGKEAGKIIGSSIEDVQKEAVDVAQKRAQERRRALREAEFKKQTALIKALESWKEKKQISDKEANLKIDFVKKYGAKEWEAVLKIKLDIENIERKANEDFQHDLKDIRRVQLMCFALAAIIAYYLTWGYK
jgi:translation initiation factor 2 alpha subunit (eIF-2alpha)